MATAQRDRFVRYIDRAADDVMGAGEINLAKVRTSRKLLKQYWTSFFELHCEVAATAVDADAEKVQDDLLFGTQMKYQTAMTFIEEKLIAFEASDNNRALPAPPVQQQPNRVELRMNKVSIEPFNGDVTLWPAFRDTFKALVHDKPNVDDAYKLFQLNAHLGPNVKHVLQGFALSAENYANVWEALLDRYDDDWKIIESHLRRFVELPSMKIENANELYSLADTTSGMLRSLPTLGLPVDQWKPFVAFWVSWKLDAVTKRDWDWEKINSKL